METLRKITVILFDTNIHKVTNSDTSIQPASSWNFTASSVKDLYWERVEQLTSPITSYGDIKYFTENAGTGIHPCVVLEIVFKWWSVRTDREHVDMSFITPLITTIQNVSSHWYYSVCNGKRYKGLTKTLDIPKPTTVREMFYMGRAQALYYYNNNNNTLKDCISNYHNLKDCISKGDGTPAQFKYFNCSYNMDRYRQSVPVFTYNAAVFPPYENTKHHWCIRTDDNHVSLIADSKEEIWNYINNTNTFTLFFVPLPDTQ